MFFVYFFNSLAVSCGFKEKKLDNIDPSSFITKITSIPINEKTDPFTLAIQYQNEKIYWLNSHSISVINLNEKSVDKIIEIEENGPNGIDYPLGFYVQNEDSLYIPTMTYRINLINGKGETLGVSDYSNYSPMGTLVSSISRYSRAFMKFDNELIFQTESLGSQPIAQIPKESIDTYSPFLSLSTSNGQLMDVGFKFPESVLNLQNFISFSQTQTDTTILLLHEFSNTLYEVNKDSWITKEYKLKSELVTDFSNEYSLSDRHSNSVQNNMRLLYKNSSNLGLVSDPFKGVIYRFGWPGEEIELGEDPLSYSDSTPYFVISIYDSKDYALIKELKLPRNIYLAHHYFVDANGLNLFPLHPKNPDFSEDEIVIHTFDFGRLE